MIAQLDATVVFAAVACLAPVPVALVVVAHAWRAAHKRRRIHRELYARGALSWDEIHDLGRVLQPGGRAR